MEIIKKIFSFIKDFWNIYLSPFISIVIAWLVNWNASQMMTINQYISLTISFMCLLTIIKHYYFPKRKTKEKKKKPIEKLVTSQKVIANMENTIDIENNINETKEIIDKTMKGSKKIMKKIKETLKKIGSFLKWVWGNKFTLSNTVIVLFIATCSQIATYTEYLYRIQWCSQNELVIKIISPICAFVFVVVDLYTTYTKYGCESKVELQARYEAKKKEKLAKLTKEQKKLLKDKISQLKLELKKKKNEYQLVLKAITNYEALRNIGYHSSSQENSDYDKNCRLENEYHNLIADLEKTIADLENQLN